MGHDASKAGQERRGEGRGGKGPWSQATSSLAHLPTSTPAPAAMRPQRRCTLSRSPPPSPGARLVVGARHDLGAAGGGDLEGLHHVGGGVVALQAQVASDVLGQAAQGTAGQAGRRTGGRSGQASQGEGLRLARDRQRRGGQRGGGGGRVRRSVRARAAAAGGRHARRPVGGSHPAMTWSTTAETTLSGMSSVYVQPPDAPAGPHVLGGDRSASAEPARQSASRMARARMVLGLEAAGRAALGWSEREGGVGSGVALREHAGGAPAALNSHRIGNQRVPRGCKLRGAAHRQSTGADGAEQHGGRPPHLGRRCNT